MYVYFSICNVFENLGFGVVPVKTSKSSGATFSKIQVDIYIYI